MKENTSKKTEELSSARGNSKPLKHVPRERTKTKSSP